MTPEICALFNAQVDASLAISSLGLLRQRINGAADPRAVSLDVDRSGSRVAGS